MHRLSRICAALHFLAPLSPLLATATDVDSENGSSASNHTCYWHKGYEATDQIVCAGSASCCGAEATCTAERLCHNPGDPPEVFVRGPCAVKEWDPAVCPQICDYDESDLFPRVTQCEDGSWCCHKKDDWRDDSCCKHGLGTFLDLHGRKTDEAPVITVTSTATVCASCTASEETGTASSGTSDASPTAWSEDGDDEDEEGDGDDGNGGDADMSDGASSDNGEQDGDANGGGSSSAGDSDSGGGSGESNGDDSDGGGNSGDGSDSLGDSGGSSNSQADLQTDNENGGGGGGLSTAATSGVGVGVGLGIPLIAALVVISYLVRRGKTPFNLHHRRFRRSKKKRRDSSDDEQHDPTADIDTMAAGGMAYAHFANQRGAPADGPQSGPHNQPPMSENPSSPAHGYYAPTISEAVGSTPVEGRSPVSPETHDMGQGRHSEQAQELAANPACGEPRP